MTYVYAITDLAAPLALADGIDGHSLLLHQVDGIGAVCSEHDCATVAPTAQNVWHHEKVVEAAMELGAVLPARFGTCMEKREEVDEVLRRNRTMIQSALQHVHGRVEMGVRAMIPPDDAPTQNTSPARSGREYLLQRAQFERRLEARREEAAALHDELSRDAIESSMPAAVTGQLLLRGAYLIDREKVDDFRKHVRKVSTAHPALHLFITGPWPPYHFVPALELKEACHA
jgi:hypothetical protein